MRNSGPQCSLSDLKIINHKYVEHPMPVSSEYIKN